MRTYKKNYNGPVTKESLGQAGSCPKCGERMTVAKLSIPHYDTESDYEYCITITNVPGFYCDSEDGCELFMTTEAVDLSVATDVYLIATAFGFIDLAFASYDEISRLNSFLNKKPRTKKYRP